MAANHNAINSGFAPLKPARANVLIVGSLPGAASLAAGQYYAHPRNAFWPVMAAVYGFDASAAYATRCRCMLAAGVMLWDVLGAAKRPGSLDAAIDTNSMQLNNFGFLLAPENTVQAVLCNGGKAYELFMRRVFRAGMPPVYKLPSTSPAYAAMRFEEKLQQWRSCLLRWQRSGG